MIQNSTQHRPLMESRDRPAGRLRADRRSGHLFWIADKVVVEAFRQGLGRWLSFAASGRHPYCPRLPGHAGAGCPAPLQGPGFVAGGRAAPKASGQVLAAGRPTPRLWTPPCRWPITLPLRPLHAPPRGKMELPEDEEHLRRLLTWRPRDDPPWPGLSSAGTPRLAELRQLGFVVEGGQAAEG